MRQSSIGFHSHRVHATAVVCGFLLIVASAQAGAGQQPDTKNTTLAPATLQANTAANTAPRTANVAEGPAQNQYAEAAGSSKPRGEGIQIHGHWVLEVKGADGEVRDRREFENSLVTTYSPVSTADTFPGTTSGAAYLAALMSGNIVPSDPAIGFVQGTLTGDPSLWCASSFIGPTNPKITCYTYTTANSLWNNGILSQLGQNGNPAVNGDVSLQLGLTRTATYTPSANLVFSGNYSVPVGLTSISAVQTLFAGCAASPGAGVTGFFVLSSTGGNSVGYGTGLSSYETADESPKVCASGNGTAEAAVLGALTSTAVTVGTTPSPMTVTTGEIVAVTVTISFS
jgi:hypothetical protein